MRATATDFESHDFNVSGESPGWTGSVANSPFERQLQRLLVPAEHRQAAG